MRRQDREVTDISEIEEIIKGCKTCHVAMVDQGKPYIIPLSFGYEMDDNEITIYFHSAYEGRKIEILKQNASICFEMCTEGEPVYAKDTPCNSGYYYSSVIGNGEVCFVDSTEEKCKALTLIMKQQANMDIAFNEQQAATVCIYKVTTKDFTGKRKPRR